MFGSKGSITTDDRPRPAVRSKQNTRENTTEECNILKGEELNIKYPKNEFKKKCKEERDKYTL